MASGESSRSTNHSNDTGHVSIKAPYQEELGYVALASLGEREKIY